MTECPVCSAQITVVSNTIVGELMETYLAFQRYA